MKNINILCTIDSNFATHFAVLLKSILYNLEKGHKITVYLLTNEKKLIENHTLLKNLKEQYGSKLTIIQKHVDIKEKYLKGIAFGHSSKAAFFRLLSPEILPKSLNKIIYLDSDILLHNSISQLNEIDPNKKHALAVVEQSQYTQYLCSPYGLSTYKELGLDPYAKHFNTGVMVINLKLWREENISKKTISYMKKYSEKMKWLDQDALNVVLFGKWGELSPLWNVQTELFYNYPWDSGSIKERSEYQTAIHNPDLIHFNTRHKPWHFHSIHPYKFLYYYYKQLLKKSSPLQLRAKTFLLLHQLTKMLLTNFPLFNILKLLRKSMYDAKSHFTKK